MQTADKTHGQKETQHAGSLRNVSQEILRDIAATEHAKNNPFFSQGYLQAHSL